MDDYQQILKTQYDKLSVKLRDFVVDTYWTNTVSNIATKFNLIGDRSKMLENEVLFVLIDLEPKNDFVENVKNELEVDSNMAGWIAEDVEKNIFSKVTNELNTIGGQIEENEKGTAQTSNGVGNSFEQIILNQARAMQPAVPPENLPTGEPNQNEPPKTIHDYTESDPYREPTE